MGLLDIQDEQKTISHELIFFVNGKKVIEKNPDPEWTLLFYLRKKLGLTGTKLGCAEGGCGACTVMVSKYDRKKDHITHLAVNACLAPVCAMHGLAITTVEGIGSTRTTLHPVQERIAKAHGSQCGFCTPGIVMSMYALLRTKPKITYQDMEVAFQGNLCRCTGYRAIIEGYKTFIEDWEQRYVSLDSHTNGGCVMGENCCKFNGKTAGEEPAKISVNGGYAMGDNCCKINGKRDDAESADISENGNCGMGENCCKFNGKTADEKPAEIFETNFAPYDSSQEPIFPPELKLSNSYDNEVLFFKGPRSTWNRPLSLDEICSIKAAHPDAKIVVGNTEVGVELKFRNVIYPTIIMPNLIPEMNGIIETDAGLTIGAAVTLAEIEATFEKYIKKYQNYKIRPLQVSIDMLNWFAGKQIRNVAALGGNIMTGSPISDMNPILMALKVKLNLFSTASGKRQVQMDEHFFTAYRKNVVRADEVLLSIEIPFATKYQYLRAYKQAKRREDDISIVTAAVNVAFREGTNIIDNINIAFGGMAPVTKLAVKTAEALKGQKWNEDMLSLCFNKLIEELPLNPSAPGGNIQFRRSLTMSLFYKAYLSIAQDITKVNISKELLDSTFISGGKQFHGQEPKSAQYFQAIGHEQSTNDAVGRTITHRSAYKQATGEAVYCDDMPKIEGELYMAFVLSTKAHAKVLSIDPSSALNYPGVEAFFCHKDLTSHQNMIGPIFHDEELFISEKVTSQGQTLGVILAQDQVTAQRAAKMVKVNYEELQPIIVTIEDAIQNKSFFPQYPKSIKKGDVKAAFEDPNNIVIEGQSRMGGQEHFYLETNVALVVPRKEDNELEIFCSSQHPTEIAKLAGHVLDIPMNRITARVKRMGGGFGGKESRGMLIALPAALAAHRLQRPVRCMLDRDEDMLMTGTRHPFLAKYKVAVTKDGKIVAARVDIYNNAGNSMDLSGSILERAMFHFENAYLIPNVEVTGYACRTNLPSNTAFRGFGGPQGMFIGEIIIRHIAATLNCPSEKIAEKNLYREDHFTHYNQQLKHCNIRRCWEECIEKSDFYNRKKLLNEFNRANRWKKRGIAIVPTKFGIAFTSKFLNQAGALVHVYMDGSILLSHGGTEMGQGLHTKMIQVASRIFDVDVSKIHITETATDRVPNTSATAASAGSDLNGMAVIQACQTIMDRLKPYKEKKPDGKWEDWVNDAYFDRVGLSATGFYATPDIGYNFATNSGNPFNYFTVGAAVTEVEIDCLSGDHLVLRTDIVMDLGQSLNPSIDIGQIEGGYMQGYGLFTLEELIYSPTGTLYSRGPGAYKIPGFGDIPLEFNVSLLKGASNPRAVYSSKAVGEPPLFLAAAAFFAIKDAISAARRDAGVDPYFYMESPATSARIRMACEDHITAKLDQPEKGSFTPWNVVP